MKKIITIICLLLLTFSLSACSDNDEKDYSNQTVMGKVVSVDDNKLTLQIATMPEGMNGTPGNMPQAQMPNEDNKTSPQKPNDGNGTPPQGQTPPSGENGSMPQMPEEGQKPEGNFGGDQGGQPPQMNGEMSDMFGDDAEKITISLEGVTIKIESGMETTDGTKDDLKANSIITVEFGDKNTVKNITIRMQGNPEPPNNQQIPSASDNDLSA